MKAVKRNVLKGFRVPVGEQFLTVYPNLSLSVKDKEIDGQLVVATAKMLNAGNGKSRLGATVHSKFSALFSNEVSWQEIDEKTGAAIEDEDITDGADEPEDNVSDNVNANNNNPTPDPNTGGGDDAGE